MRGTRRLRSALVVSAAACGLASIWASGCAYDWSFPNDGLTADGGGGKDTGTESETSTKDVDVDRATDDVFVPPPTSCKSSSECDAKSYCVFPDKACGGVSLGLCKPVPVSCTPDGRPVCGCSGVAHGSTCEAAQKRDDVGETPCTPPGGMFQCGATFCKTTSEFCVRNGADTKCESFGSCGTAKCACTEVQKLGCGSCDDSVPGEVRVKCP